MHSSLAYQRLSISQCKYNTVKLQCRLDFEESEEKVQSWEVTEQ